jgi:probable phosphoglycerate mutase
MKIYLIRHGETTGDIEDRYGGDYDDHLSEEGKRQAEELASKLANSGIEIIFCSPLIRAQETAVFLKERVGCPVETIKELKERNQYGMFSGMVKADVKEKYPGQFAVISDYKQALSEAETYESCKQRIIDIWEKLTNSDYGTIAILSHGGPIKVVFREILKLGEIKAGDCGFAVFEKTGDNIQLLEADGIALENQS